MKIQDIVNSEVEEVLSATDHDENITGDFLELIGIFLTDNRYADMIAGDVSEFFAQQLAEDTVIDDMTIGVLQSKYRRGLKKMLKSGDLVDALSDFKKSDKIYINVKKLIKKYS